MDWRSPRCRKIYLSVVPSDAHRLSGEATFGNDCKARLAEEKSTSHCKVSRNLAATVFRRSHQNRLTKPRHSQNKRSAAPKQATALHQIFDFYQSQCASDS